MKEILKRFKSPIVITSMLSLIFLILTNLKVIDLDNDTIQNIINAIITILVGFGIINNPTDTEKF